MKQIIMMTKDGCGSCKEFKPKAKEIAQELGYEFRVLPNPEIEVPFFPYYYMMSEGKVITVGTPAEVQQHPVVLEAYLGHVENPA